MRIKRKSSTAPKLNLIPILDAVFIFIFFLLMSAQFLDVYEIGSDAPAVVTLENKKDKKDPLNLVLIIDSNQIVVKSGMEELVYKTIKSKNGSYNYTSLQETLIEIKSQHVDEKSIIFKPRAHISYKKIIELMDAVKSISEKYPILMVKNAKGQLVKTRTLFDQIIFETII